MRKLVLAPVVAALVAVAGGTTATATIDSRFVGTYFTFTMCTNAGEAGVSDGRWDSYNCRLKRVGLDAWYDLYVSP